MTEKEITTFLKARDSLKELYGEPLGDIEKRVRPHLDLIQELANSVYPDEVAAEIYHWTTELCQIIDEYKKIWERHARPLEEEEYEEAEEEMGEESEIDGSDKYDKWETRKNAIESRLQRREDLARQKILNDSQRQDNEFGKIFAKLIAVLDKWEVAKYPDSSKSDIIQADIDRLAQRLARGEISEKTYGGAVKRLEDQLKKIERMKRK